MRHTATLAADPLAASAGGRESRAAVLMRDLAELTKPRITKLVVVTTMVGFAMGAMVFGQGGIAGRSAGTLAALAIATALGTALCSSGAAALNEWLERVRDAAMRRTANRPIPAGRLSASTGLLVGLACSALGLVILAAFANWASALVALATIVSYVVIYTPLKPVTPLAAIVGAAPGAVPPLIGWAGAWQGGAFGLDHPGGWSIVAIMTVWQIPHFLALAWKYREDYALGGHRVLPVVDPSGASTAFTTVVWSAALIPVSLAAVLAMRWRGGEGLLGWPYAVAAVLLGGVMLAGAIRFAVRRDDRSAALLFFGSIAYLPLLLIAMVGDALAAALFR
ncbi:MAG: heme o synthase [Phycisphaerales bacterium]